MKVIYLVPGSGESFYCQNCLRDLALVKALRAQGLNVLSVPLYLPLSSPPRTEAGVPPVFYGAIRVYLEQRFPWIRRWPRWMTRWLDSPALLAWAAKKSGSTRASGLEEMTLSMLRGEQGNQSRELDELVVWLNQEGKPDVVHLSNALLLGLARQIKNQLDTKVVCSLQDEDQWVDAMSADAARRTWDLMAERARDVDGLATVSHFYAQVMAGRLRIPKSRIQVIPIGIDVAGYTPSPLPLQPPVIGYLSRLSESLGLGVLAEAFIELKRDPRFRALKLRAIGGLTGDDAAFLADLRRRLNDLGYLPDVEFGSAFDRQSRVDFLRSLSVLSVPIPKGEAFGTFQLEALAAGVPLVQPRVGAFPEVIEQTGGGLLYDPSQPGSLTQTLAELLANPELARRLADTGRRQVLDHFTIQHMAENTSRFYQSILSPTPRPPGP